MFKLKVVKGPQKGQSFELHEGQNSLGRQPSNVIHIRSKRISKVHCVFEVNGGSVTVEDHSSANGTFVNGVLEQKRRRLRRGDQVSIGEHVLKLVERDQMTSDQGEVEFDSFIPTSGMITQEQLEKKKSQRLARNGDSGLPDQSLQIETVEAVDTAPKDFQGKLAWGIERFIMPPFYSLNLRYEWRTICVGLGLLALLGILLVSVTPLLSTSYQSIKSEAARRARFMALQIADQNSAFLAAGQESRTSVGLADQDMSVQLAILMDLENRIIAPGSQMNQYLASGPVAEVAVRASAAFSKKGRERGVIKTVSDSLIVAIEPVKVYDPKLGRNRVIALSLVALDLSQSTFDYGTIGVIYSNAFVLSVLIAGIFLFIGYRLTLKRFELLNEDIDRFLRGEATRITNDFKASEFNDLLNVVDASLQRIPRGGGDADLEQAAESRNIEDFVSSVQMLSEVSQAGMLLVNEEKQILYMNSQFEEVTGIRSEVAMGSSVEEAARDEAFVALCDDLFSQATATIGESITEDFDFGGVPFKIRAVAVGGESVIGFLLIVVKDDFA